ncbi:hypothetical protein MTO96_023392 [Rhipicephalus appendiculatus]
MKKGCPPQTPGGFKVEPAMTLRPAEATALQSGDGMELAEGASKSCSEDSSVALPPMPTLPVTERHTTRTAVRVVEDVVTTLSSTCDSSWPCTGRCGMSLRLPPYATSEGQAVRGEARAAEESIVISASEASEVEQAQDDEAFMVSDDSSDVLPEVLPTRVESPKDSWSRSCGETTLEQGDVALAELTSMPSEHLKEPLEMPREATVVPASAALDVGEERVQQSLGGYAVSLSEDERSWLKSGEHLHAPDTPATPAQPERWAVGESTASFVQ